MRHWLIFLCLILANFQAAAELPPVVASELANAGIPEASVAVYVRAVADDGAILSHNADKSMNPASVMKLVTTNAALNLLSPTFRWKTEVYKSGNVLNSTLRGDLIIKGYGDPSFNAQDFWRLLITLQQAGIKKITGDLIIDKDYFDKEEGRQDTFDGEVWRAYNAPPSAFLVNGRNTSFRFKVTDSAVQVNQEFELAEIKIINHMKLVESGCAAWRDNMTYQMKVAENGVVVTFGGTFSPSCGEKYLELSLFDDEKYAFFTFKKLWRELGGGFSGRLKIGETPDAAVKVLEQTSAPLGYVVHDINKWSNNLMARQLLLTIGAEQIGAPATESKGEAAIKDWLFNKGLRFNELVVDNGSGLSHTARITAEHMGQMLVGAYHEPAMPEFIASMPILARDGTVMGRLKNSQSNGRAHLKTGSLNGVSAIAGYVLDANGHRHALVMLVNHAKAGASKAAQDALIEWVHQLP